MQISTSKEAAAAIYTLFEETIKSPLTRKREFCAHLRLRIFFALAAALCKCLFFYCSAVTAVAFF
jgi:hypothetical protein